MGVFSSDRKKLDDIRAVRRIQSIDPSPDPVGDFGSGLVAGLKEDPFVALAMKGLSEIPGVSADGLEEVRRKTRGSTAAQAGKFIGEFGPSLLLGIASFGGGLLAARTAVMGVARQVAMKDAVRLSLKGIGRGVTRNEASAGLQPARGFIKKSLDRSVRKQAGNKAGAETIIQGTPGVQIAAERAGASAGIGSLVTSQDLARGKGPIEALKNGALAAALTLGIDTALVGGSRLLFRGSRSVDVAAIKARAEKRGVNRLLQTQIEKENTNVEKLTKKLRGVLKIDDQQRELSFFHGTRAARSKEILATPKADDLVRTIRAAKGRSKELVAREATEGVNPYLGQGPGSEPTLMGRLLNRVDSSGGMRAFFTKLIVAPESRFGSQGEAANKFFTRLKNGLTRSITEEEELGVVYSRWGEAIMKAVGMKSKEFKRGIGKNLDLSHEWERIGGGPEAVKKFMKDLGRTDEQAEQVISIFTAREELERNLYLVRAKPIGSKMEMDLEAGGVGRWLSHASLELNTKGLVKNMVSSGKYTEKEAYEIMRRRAAHLDPPPVGKEGIQTTTPVRNGPLEFNREFKGTTKDKILGTLDEATGKRVGGGLPLNPNVWDSGFQTARSAVRRIHTDPILGGAVNTEKGRVTGGTIDDLVKLVELEGGSGIQVKAVIEAMTGRTYYDESMRAWATALTSIQTAAKLPMAFLANATQPVLTTTWLGYKASLKGMRTIANKTEREHLAQAMNIHKHISRALGHSMDQDGLALTSLEKMADWTLRFTGFSSIEKFNRIHGAAATQAMVRDRLARGAADKLRGVRLDTARKMFGEVGLDFNGLVRELRDTGPEVFFKSPKFLDQEFTAMIQGAQKTQFFPGPTRTPQMWKHPLARTMLQFKTFSVGQSRLIRDGVLAEYANGNMAPLATYLSAAPIAGEFVGNARSLIKDKDRTDSGLMRGLHNMSYIGGLGIVTDMFQVAQWGKLENFILGPAISDILEATEFTMTGEFDQLRKMVERQPAFQAGDFLMGATAETTGILAGYLDSVGSEGDSPGFIDIGQRLTDRVHNKRR